MCDVNVGINNLFYNELSSFLMWIFYFPSQVLITLSYFLENK